MVKTRLRLALKKLKLALSERIEERPTGPGIR